MYVVNYVFAFLLSLRTVPAPFRKLQQSRVGELTRISSANIRFPSRATDRDQWQTKFSSYRSWELPPSAEVSWLREDAALITLPGSFQGKYARIHAR